MSQVSYGTITITDTTDIEDVFLIYKGSSSNTVAPSIVWSDNTHNDWETDITQITGDYIWAITVFKRTGITITSTNYTDYYSDPVCLTGEPGTSISITSIKYSTLTTQTQPADSTFTLTSPPAVPEGEWLWSRTLFSNGQSMYSKAKQGKSPTVSKTGNTVTIVGADGNTVTVTDGTNGQSYYTYVRYSANSDGSNMVTTPTSSTKYIGVYSGTSSTVPAYTSFTWSKYVGENGSPGGAGPQGVSVTSVRELYYLTAGAAPNKPTSSTTIYDDDRVGAWTSVVPSYIVDGNYYISLETTLSNSTKVWSDVILDQALTDANYNAYLAQSLSQNANENANGALSQANSNINSVIRLWQAKSVHSMPNAPSSEVTTGSTSTYNTWSTVKPTATDTYRYFYYCDQSKTGGGVCSWSEVIEDTSYLSTYEINALNIRTKNFFKGLDNTYDGWFASGRLTSEGLNESNAETYLYNARFAATHISLGYNKTPIIDLDGSSGAIDIYRFPTINSNTGLVTAAGKLGMKLNATSLIFYKPDESSAAILNSNGLVLSEGGIEAGTKNTTNYIYVYSKDDSNHSIAINNSGNKTDWRIVAGNKFGVDKAGNLYASNATISGAITATSLTLSSGVQIPASTGISGLSTVATTGSYNDLDNKPTIPSLTGYIYVDGTVGTTPADGATGFVVSSSGLLTASNAVIYGSIYASKGYIGGWQIGTDGNKTLHNGNVNTSPIPGSGVIILSKGIVGPTTATGVLPANQTWAITASNQFGVTTAGKLYASGADINGAIIATSLKIGNGATDYANDITTISSKASGDAEYEVVIKVNSIDYTTSSATLIAIPTKLGTSTTGTFTWYKNAINTAHGGTVSTTTNTNDTLTVTDLNALYIAVLQ